MITPADLLTPHGARELSRLATPEGVPTLDPDLLAAVVRGEDVSDWEGEDIAQAQQALATLQAATDAASARAFAWSVDVPVAAPRLLTHKQFADRFTADELQAILAASDASPALRSWWEQFKLAIDINLDDPATQAGVHALEIAGLIAAGRAEEVLA